MKRAMKGEFDLFGKAETLLSSLDKISDGAIKDENYFAEKKRYVSNFKKAILLCITGASKQFDKQLINEQEVLNNIADMMMETYVSESLMLRINKLETMKGNMSVYRDILDVNIFDTAEVIRKSAYEAVYSFASPEKAPGLIKAIDELSRVKGINVKDARRRIADKLIEDNSYKF